MDDIDKQFEELMKYKKVNLAQMIILQRISVDSLNEIINKMKCCENCKHHRFMGNELDCKIGLCEKEEKWELLELK